MRAKLFTVLALVTLMADSVFAGDNWQKKLQQELPLLGHRNWIAVVDSAYPLQTSPGVETVYADADQLEVVKGVIAALAKTRHVKPTIFTDAELKYVAETNAPGISAYREALAKILADQPGQVLPHEQIISKLDEAGKTFKVLIIKTTLTKPYTSVFFQLECGYWNADAEQQLRASMRGVQSSLLAPSIRWICSTPSEPWQERSADIVLSGADVEPNGLQLNPQTVYQKIDGFGGCFNELGWDALQALDSEQRTTALRALFDVSGCHFNLGRVGMGANDFARDWYSFDETPGDYALTNFSIARDRAALIPFIKAAMQYQPELAVWGVPWSPPSWMKTSNSYRGGNMKTDPQTLTAYALYFAKYIQAYRAEGINLYAIHPQNEPVYNNNVYPQCFWTGPQINLFLRDYLIPQLKQDQLDVQVWLGTLVSPKLADYTDPVLGDAKTAPAITGVGYQYGGQEAMLATHKKYPDKKMLQTETECYKGANSWEEGENTFQKIIGDMNHFANGYTYWNLVLNEKSTSTWGWKQNSLLKIDTQTKKIIYNPEFYSLKHFAHFVQPGAVRIGLSVMPKMGADQPAFSDKNVVAFRNPSGELILLIGNRGQLDLPVTVRAGRHSAELKIPGQSMNSIVLMGW